MILSTDLVHSCTICIYNTCSSSRIKSYSETKDINSTKGWVCDLGRWGGGVMVSSRVHSCLATPDFCGVTVNWLPDSAAMFSFGQMLRIVYIFYVRITINSTAAAVIV